MVWWHTGIDFKGVHIIADALRDNSDDAIIFKFNYTLNRELYEIRTKANGVNSPTRTVSASALDKATCQLGDYTHNNTAGNRTLTICASSKGKTQLQ